MWLVADGIRSSLVIPPNVRPSPAPSAAVAAIAISNWGGRKRTAKNAVDVKCTAQEVNISASRKASISVQEAESISSSSQAELAVPPADTPAKIAASRFESAAYQLKISLHQSTVLPSQLQLMSKDEAATDDELAHLDENGSSPPGAASDETPDAPSTTRRKRIWRGVRRQRRMPPQLPWTADDFARRAQLMMESILSETGENHRLLVSDILDSWLGKITRVELTRLIKDLGLRKRPSLAVEVFCWMQRQRGRLKPTPRVYCSIIGVLGRAGLMSKAREIFDARQPKSLESVPVYNAMMGAYVKCGRFKRAWKLYEDLCEAGLAADEITFNTLLSGISRADMPLKTAEKLFSKMKLVGISPGRYTYNTLVTVFSKCGHLEGAAAILEEMRAANKMPDLRTFNTVISMYGRAGRYEEALQVFNILRAAGFDPDVVTHTCLMQMFSRAQNLHAAMGQFSEMQRAGCAPDAMAYSLMIHVYGKAGLAADAEQIFEKMQEAGFQPNIVTWSSLIQAYSRKGMLDKVGSCFAEMQKSGCRPDASLFNIMMTAYKQAELPIHAASLFRRMQSQGVEPNAACFNTLIHAFSESGQREDAKSLHEQMVRAGFAPDKLSRRFLNNLSPRRGKHRDPLQSQRNHHPIHSLGPSP